MKGLQENSKQSEISGNTGKQGIKGPLMLKIILPPHAGGWFCLLGKTPQTPLNIQAKLEWLRISTETLLLQINTIKGL